MRIAWPLVLLLFASCGGSSSETPPPLEPDPTGYRYSGPRLPSADEEAAAATPEPEVDEDDLPPNQKRQPAAATWGSGKPARHAAPVPSASASAAPLPPAAPSKD